MTASELTVAAFDVDGTLTRRDTFLPFLVELCGPAPVGRALAAAAARQGRSRDALKAAVVRRLLAGRSADEVLAAGRAYAGRVVERRLRPDAVARLRWHQQSGHAVLLVSASPTAYLDEVGRLLGVDAVLATAFDVGADGRLTGELLGLNCRGPEKVRRVTDWLGGRTATLWAYGDSRGDRELLAMAAHGHLVRARRRFPSADGLTRSS